MEEHDLGMHVLILDLYQIKQLINFNYDSET